MSLDNPECEALFYPGERFHHVAGGVERRSSKYLPQEIEQTACDEAVRLLEDGGVAQVVRAWDS